ncbi:MAG: peptide deformylase [Acidobacteria bacterium]|nr:peptide deformylase [Acidobacteriota bacterium]
MSILQIVRLGHPALRTVAQALAPGRIGEAGVQALIDDMIETMRAAHGVGLAAPQVGTSLQLFVYELAPPSLEAPPPSPLPLQAPPPAQEPAAEQAPAEARGSGQADGGDARAAAPASSGAAGRPAAAAIPLHVVINPMLTPQAGELVYDWEGCLSIPDLRGLVPRHPAVRVRGLDRQGRPLDYVAQGFEARIVQHEFDHLNGVVFLDRMRDLKALAFREEWERYMAAGAADPTDPLDPQAPPSRSRTSQAEEPILAAGAAAHRGEPEVI